MTAGGRRFRARGGRPSDRRPVAASSLVGLVALAATVAAPGCRSETAVSPSTSAPRTLLSSPISIDPSGSVVVPDEIDGAKLGSCAKVALAYEAAMGDIRTLAGGATRADFDRVESAFDTLEATLPTEIRAPFRVIHDAVIAFGTKADTFDLSTSDGLLALSQAAEVLDSPEVREAGDRIDEYFVTTCAEPEVPDGTVGPPLSLPPP